MAKRITLLLIVINIGLSMFNSLYAQELNCTVKITFDQMEGSTVVDQSVPQQLQAYVNDFFNKRTWTTDQFAVEERIKCQLNINVVRSPSPGSYEANAVFNVSRPIFNSNSETVTFTYVDRAFNFQFLPNTPYYYNENSYTDELSYSLAFYAYIALAVDYDSFSKLGGTPYIQKAFNVANLARNASAYQRTWSTNGDSRSRYALIENLNSQQFIPYREGLYKYHRLGMDTITETPTLARQQILETLQNLKQVSLLRPGAILLNSFFDAKTEELYQVLNEGTAEEKQTGFSLLSSMDPGKTESYRRLVRPTGL